MHPRWRTGSRSPPRWPPVNAAALGLSPAQRSEACPGLRQARHCPTPLSLPWVCVCPEPFSVPVPVFLSVPARVPLSLAHVLCSHTSCPCFSGPEPHEDSSGPWAAGPSAPAAFPAGSMASASPSHVCLPLASRTSISRVPGRFCFCLNLGLFLGCVLSPAASPARFSSQFPLSEVPVCLCPSVRLPVTHAHSSARDGTGTGGRQALLGLGGGPCPAELAQWMGERHPGGGTRWAAPSRLPRPLGARHAAAAAAGETLG